MIKTKKEKMIDIVKYTLLILISAVFALPLIWMVLSSFKIDTDIFLYPPKLLPIPFKGSTYATAWKSQEFTLFAFNTLKITFFNIIFAVFSSAMVAFGFARLRFPGRNLLFAIVISTMMIPYEVLVIPQYILYKNLDWLNTHLPLIVPSLFANAFFIFFIRQYMMGIPLELDEASRIDGCNTFQLFYKIILPLIVPAMTTCVIFQFMWCWNDFFAPLVFLQSQDKWTFTLGITAFKNQVYGYVKWNEMMAISVIFSSVPIVIFFLAQDKLIGGLSTTGLKS